MIHATPVSVPPGRRAFEARTPLVALFPAAVLAGAGLGLVVLALMTPPPGSALLPPPIARTPGPAAAPVADEAAQAWAPLFGTIPEQVAPATPADEPDAPELFSETIDDGGLVLRGLALPDDPDEAFAIVEGDDGIHVVRIGSLIADRFEVQEITADGMAVLNLDTDEIVEVLFPEDHFGTNAGPDGATIDGGYDSGSDDDAEQEGLASDETRRSRRESSLDLDLYRGGADSRSEFVPGNTGIPSFGISR